MSIQNIIDTYNYSAVTGCRLSESAASELYREILGHINWEALVTEQGQDSPVGPQFVLTEGDVPKDFMTFTGYRPRTKNLYLNYSELELLRILFMLKPEHLEYASLYERTRKRIKDNCFGDSCTAGECFEISITALRFIATVFPEEIGWIDMYVRSIAQTIRQQKRQVSKRSILMFCQVVSELRRDMDSELIDEMLWYIDNSHLHKVSRVSAAVNDCILYSSLRRTVLAS